MLLEVGRATHRSVAICSFAMLVRSSRLAAADKLVRGVLVALLPLTDVAGVDEVASFGPLDAAFAAFSANRFCLDADGAIAC